MEKHYAQSWVLLNNPEFRMGWRPHPQRAAPTNVPKGLGPLPRDGAPGYELEPNKYFKQPAVHHEVEHVSFVQNSHSGTAQPHPALSTPPPPPQPFGEGSIRSHPSREKGEESKTAHLHETRRDEYRKQLLETRRGAPRGSQVPPSDAPTQDEHMQDVQSTRVPLRRTPIKVSIKIVHETKPTKSEETGVKRLYQPPIPFYYPKQVKTKRRT